MLITVLICLLAISALLMSFLATDIRRAVASKETWRQTAIETDRTLTETVKRAMRLQEIIKDNATLYQDERDASEDEIATYERKIDEVADTIFKLGEKEKALTAAFEAELRDGLTYRDRLIAQRDELQRERIELAEAHAKALTERDIAQACHTGALTLLKKAEDARDNLLKELERVVCERDDARKSAGVLVQRAARATAEVNTVYQYLCNMSNVLDSRPLNRDMLKSLLDELRLRVRPQVREGLAEKIDIDATIKPTKIDAKDVEDLAPKAKRPKGKALRYVTNAQRAKARA